MRFISLVVGLSCFILATSGCEPDVTLKTSKSYSASMTVTPLDDGQMYVDLKVRVDAANKSEAVAKAIKYMLDNSSDQVEAEEKVQKQ